MEMMHHEAGVRTVVVGGRPETGPMQAPAGTRGALSYDSVSLDIDIGNAETINITTTSYLPDRAEDQAVWISTASFNMRDQVRNGESTPLQFVYEAANCRIFYTFNTIYNYTNLWQYAANAIWSNPGLCVQGSTGYATTNGTASNTQGPPGGSTIVNANVSHNASALTGLSGVNPGLHFITPGEDDGPSKNSRAPGQVGSVCTPSTGCIGALCQPNILCKGQSQSQCSYVATISAAPLALACASIRTLWARVKALVVSWVNRSRIEQRATVYHSQLNAFRQQDLALLTSLPLENLMMRLGNRQNDKVTLRAEVWAT